LEEFFADDEEMVMTHADSLSPVILEEPPVKSAAAACINKPVVDQPSFQSSKGTLVEYLNRKNKWVAGRILNRDLENPQSFHVLNEYALSLSVAFSKIRLVKGSQFFHITDVGVPKAVILKSCGAELESGGALKYQYFYPLGGDSSAVHRILGSNVRFIDESGDRLTSFYEETSNCQTSARLLSSATEAVAPQLEVRSCLSLKLLLMMSSS
jgi:hypothetical protein